MNVGLYSGAAGMKVGQDYQELISENLSLQSVPGYRQMLPVFTTSLQAATGNPQQPFASGKGNPAAVQMTRVVDFTQGSIEPSGGPYHVAIQGQAFFEVKEANGGTSYTRNGSFSVSPRGELHTSDGATVLGKGGSPLTVNVNKPGNVSISADGSISVGGVSIGKLGVAHFDNPSAALQPGAFGRFVAKNAGDAHEGLAPHDQIMPNSLEQSNGNPVQQMAEMLQAVRLYEANQKSIQAVDENQNQLISTLGARAQA